MRLSMEKLHSFPMNVTVRQLDSSCANKINCICTHLGQWFLICVFRRAKNDSDQTFPDVLSEIFQRELSYETTERIPDRCEIFRPAKSYFL